MAIDFRPKLGVPNLTPGMPAFTPAAPPVQPHAPIETVNQAAEQAVPQLDDGAPSAEVYAGLRSFVPEPGALTCKGCSSDGPSLRDVAPPSLLGRIPTWARWAIGGTVLLGSIGLLTFAVRRRGADG